LFLGISKYAPSKVWTLSNGNVCPISSAITTPGMKMLDIKINAATRDLIGFSI
jgi:hypothetical protein